MTGLTWQLNELVDIHRLLDLLLDYLGTSKVEKPAEQYTE